MSEESASERRTRLRAEWENDQKKGAAGDGNTDKLKDGKNCRRVLPKKDPEDPFYESYAMHFNIGPEAMDSHLCIEPGGPFGGQSQSDKNRDKKRGYRAKVCPSCKNFCKFKNRSRKFKHGTDVGIAYWRDHVVQWRAKRQYVFAVTRPKSKRPTKVYVHKCGVMIGQPLLGAYYDQDSGGDFTDVKTGRNVIITKKQLSKKDATNVEYNVQITPDRTALGDLWKKIKKRLPDLKSFIPEPMDPEAIQALIDGDGDTGESEDKPSNRKRNRGRDDADISDDDDGEEREVRTGKRKRGADEEVDPDAPEESDDIDKELKAARKARRKAKKSKMRARLERRANRDKDL